MFVENEGHSDYILNTESTLAAVSVVVEHLENFDVLCRIG